MSPDREVLSAVLGRIQELSYHLRDGGFVPGTLGGSCFTAVI